MITNNDLRQMVIFGRLTDAMLDRLLPMIEVQRFNEGDHIFKEGDTAETFFLLKSGKVLLEQRLSDKMTVSIDAIKPGYSFGWSAMLGGGIELYSRYTSDAICVEPCTVYMIIGDDIREQMQNDHTMGYFLTRRLNQVIKQRLMHRTEQFVRIIKQHPDIDNLING